ncbi:hypothetical protein Patl1_10889 [Pistacia atlantica]|uniref:Uncharacterized protein n=1 Tax=Pistacia atlantica TaxID=434234 RepID=A0ACC1A8H2_9ROSI|nr:hypothetical protein Patl1_10889 [Pistacia atlantica]
MMFPLDLVGSEDWQSSYPPPPQLNYGCQMPSQVNSVYQGVGSYSEAYQGYQNHPMPRAPTRYGNYSSNERSSVLETEPNPITLRIMVPHLGVELILTKAMQLLIPTANPILGLILIGLTWLNPLQWEAWQLPHSLTTPLLDNLLQLEAPKLICRLQEHPYFCLLVTLPLMVHLINHHQ